MLTLLTYVLGLLLVGGLLFLAASFAFGRGEQMAPALPEGTPVELPDDRPAAGADLRALRLSVVLRGYRMEEVDWVLDRLAEQLDSRDREIARLRSVLHVEPVGVGARTEAPPRDNGSHATAEPALLTHPVAAPIPARLDAPAGADPVAVSGERRHAVPAGAVDTSDPGSPPDPPEATGPGPRDVPGPDPAARLGPGGRGTPGGAADAGEVPGPDPAARLGPGARGIPGGAPAAGDLPGPGSAPDRPARGEPAGAADAGDVSGPGSGLGPREPAEPDPAYLPDPAAEMPERPEPVAGGEPAADLPDQAYLDDPAGLPMRPEPSTGGEPATDLPDQAYLDDPAETREPGTGKNGR